MSFNLFLDIIQKIFNIFCDKGEHMDDRTQVSELFRRVCHPQLQDMVKVLEFRSDLNGIKYLEATNHRTASVSKMPEYQFSQKFAGIQSR